MQSLSGSIIDFNGTTQSLMQALSENSQQISLHFAPANDAMVIPDTKTSSGRHRT